MHKDLPVLVLANLGLRAATGHTAVVLGGPMYIAPRMCQQVNVDYVAAASCNALLLLLCVGLEFSHPLQERAGSGS